MRSRIIATIAIAIFFFVGFVWYLVNLPIDKEMEGWQSITAASIAFVGTGCAWMFLAFKAINWVNRK